MLVTTGLTKVALYSIMIFLSASVRSQDVELLSHISGSGNENITVLTEIDGQPLVGGDFADELIIGATQFESVGLRDLFLARLDEENDAIQAITFGGPDRDEISFLQCVDNQVIIAGHFWDRLHYKDDTLVAQLGSKVIYILMLDSQFDLMGAMTIEGSGDKDLMDFDISDNAKHLTIRFSNQIVLDNDTIMSESNESLALLTFDQNHSLIEKDVLHCSGTIARSRRSGTGADYVCSGSFTDSLFSDSMTIQTATNDQDVFQFTRRATNFQLRRFGGVFDQSLQEVVLDSMNHYWLLGSLEGVMNLGDTSIQSVGFQPNIFVVRFDPNGELDFAQSIGQQNLEQLNQATWYNDLLWLGGYFEDQLDIGFVADSKGTSDLFFAAMDESGVVKDVLVVGDMAAEFNPIFCISDRMVIGYPFIGQSDEIVEMTSTNFDAAVVSVIHSTSTKQIGQLSFSVYPNPVDDILYIEFPVGQWKKGTIFDSKGRICHKFIRSPVNIAHLDSGIYWIQLISHTGNRASRKIFIP